MSLLHLISAPTVEPDSSVTGSGALSLPLVDIAGTGATASQAASSWVGIPDPQDYLGLNYDPLSATEPADPANWPSAEAAGYYYIDSSHGSATDTSNTYGYPDQPRLTAPTSATIGAGGKYILVGDGETYSGSNITITVSGTTNTANGYAWIGGSYSTSRPIIFDRIFTISGSYYICDGIHHKADGQDDKIVATGGYATVRNFEVTGETPLLESSVSGNRMSVGNNSVYYNGTIHDHGDWLTDSAADMHGFKMNGPSNIFILDVLGYHLQGDTVQVGDVNGAGSDYIFLGNVSGYENKENTIDVKDSSDVIISGGYSHSMTTDWGDDQGEAIVIHDDAAYCWVINHEIWDCNIGIYNSSTNGLGGYIGNVIRDTNRAIYNHAAGGAIVNCTFDNYLRAAHFNTASSNPEVKNSCFNNRRSSGSNLLYDIWVEQSTDYAALDSDYNAFEDFRGAGEGGNEDNPPTAITSIASWNGDGNSQEGAHGFVDEVGNDFTPDTGSHLIANSDPSEPSAITAFEARYSWTVVWKDINGTTRPASYTDWDIGAIQS